MRFGQVHRAGPLAGGHLRQIAGFQLLIAVRHQRRDRALVRPGYIEKARLAEHSYSPNSAPTNTAAPDRHMRDRPQGRPSRPRPGLIGLLETFGGGDAAVVLPLAAFDVAYAVERLNDLLNKFCAFGQHRLDNVDRRLGKARAVRVFGVVEHVAQWKDGVAHRRFVSRHCRLQQKTEAARRRQRPFAGIRFIYELSWLLLQGQSGHGCAANAQSFGVAEK